MDTKFADERVIELWELAKNDADFTNDDIEGAFIFCSSNYTIKNVQNYIANSFSKIIAVTTIKNYSNITNRRVTITFIHTMSMRKFPNKSSN